MGGEGGGVRLLEALRVVVGEDVPAGGGRMRVRGQRIRVTGRGCDWTGREATLETVCLANEELEDVVEHVTRAWGAFRKVRSCQKAHGFTCKERQILNVFSRVVKGNSVLRETNSDDFF